jgi:hypothetical protein
MKSKQEEFKAVEFMRKQRTKLSRKYRENRKEFLKELDQAMNAFLKPQKKVVNQD